MPYEKKVLELHPDAPLMLSALKKVKERGAYAEFDKDLKATRPKERGYAYAAASCILGPKTPQDWKEKAKCLLLASERPFFD